ncbi:MAG TPA: hypothetical protein VN622_13685 [Clostridia bacterium]|nr:hypothetical protein [Clostridia bacterium]
MRNLFIALALLVSTVAVAATPCKSGAAPRKLNRTSLQNVQKKVNLGADSWRFDAKEVAAREVESIDTSQKAAVVKGALKPIKSDERTAVLTYAAPDRSFDITLKKPEWLLPYSGIYKTMMWIVTDVKTTCATDAKKSPKPAPKTANK